MLNEDIKNRLDEIINGSVFLEKYRSKLSIDFNHCYNNVGFIRYNNYRITSKFVTIYFSVVDNNILLEVLFNGDISNKVFDLSIYNKYMLDKEYIKPKYAHENVAIKLSLNLNDTCKIKRFIEDIVKIYLLKGW